MEKIFRGEWICCCDGVFNLGVVSAVCSIVLGYYGEVDGG